MMQVARSKSLGTLGRLVHLLLQKLHLCRTAVCSLRGTLREHSDQDSEKEFFWLEAYKAALLEFDERRLPGTIEAAMQAIEERRRVLGGARNHIQERNLLEHAALSLWAIRASRSSRLTQLQGRASRITTRADENQNAA